MLTLSAIGAVVLALIHFFGYKLKFSSIPRSKWLSAAGGISVAYVFIHLLPELEEWQSTFKEENKNILPFLSYHLYLLALSGLVIFYGIERAAKLSAESRRDNEEQEEVETSGIFYLHISTFCMYNALIGYLLVHRDTQNVQGLIWFIVAMSFHFIVNDYGLFDHYRKKYLHKGRYFLALAVVGGWGIGAISQVSETVVAVLFSVVAGSVILNVLKEELPEERKSNFWAFFTGIVLYSTLLLAT